MAPSPTAEATRLTELRELFVGRIAKKDLPPEGDDGRVGFRQTELFEEEIDFPVGFEVEPLEEHPVPRQEVTNSKRILRKAGPDHPEPGEAPGFGEQLPARDEGLKDEIREIRALVQELP